MKSTVVFTCVTGGYELPKEGQPFNEADFVLFTDDMSLETSWQKRQAVDLYKDPRRVARHHKLLPHLYLPEYEFHIWMDGCVCMLCPVAKLIEELGDNDILTFTHPDRKTLADEAIECIQKKRDNPQIIADHLGRIVSDGFPDNIGLAETRVLIRKNNKEVRKFNREWFYQLATGSLRDQMSFNYVVWKTGVKVKYMPAINRGNEWFENIPHVKTTYG
jgi:hypothetical protein